MNDETHFQDYRANAAGYYDRFCTPPSGDIEFYRSLVTDAARVLELGCGSGRVLAPLAGAAAYVHGLDHSPSMLELCRSKLTASDIAERQAAAEQADITDFDLTARMPRFDLITAPYRVMQNLETDGQVAGLLGCIRRHLASDGVAVLNTFCPRRDPEAMKVFWDTKDGREPVLTIQDGAETVEVLENCLRHRDHPLVVYPEITYRRRDASGRRIDEAKLRIPMRVWYPDQLTRLIESHGFAILDRMGGYEGEPWGGGSELVVVFRHAG